MRILVDADACPVKEIIEKIAIEKEIEVIMYLDNTHELHSDYSKIVIVDKAMDSADMAILKEVTKDDIVVTQDYGLASLVLNKEVRCLNQNGLIYTSLNIDQLLFERFLGKETRRMGIKHKNMRKRNLEDDNKFEIAFLKLINQ